jgi:hypothetical protein
MYAARYGNEDVLRILREYGCDAIAVSHVSIREYREYYHHRVDRSCH